MSLLYIKIGGEDEMDFIYNRNKKEIIERNNELTEFVEKNNLACDGKIVLLTNENAKIIENLLEKDDEYFPFAKIIFDHYGLEKVKDNRDRALLAVAKEIDRDNNTGIWRYKTNLKKFYDMIEYIKNPENRFFERLENGEKTLPDEITKKCENELKSLASKICKYLSEFAFGKDNYYINDSFVRHMLLFYLDFYEVEHDQLKSNHAVDKLSYKELFEWLEKLHKARNEKHGDDITKSQLDHIIWYCYKNKR